MPVCASRRRIMRHTSAERMWFCVSFAAVIGDNYTSLERQLQFPFFSPRSALLLRGLGRVVRPVRFLGCAGVRFRRLGRRLLTALGLLQPVARYVQFQNHAM